VLGGNDDQGIFVNVFGLKGCNYLSQRGIHEVKCFQEIWSECKRAVLVALGFLANRNSLEVPTKECWSGGETRSLDFGMFWRFAINPLQEGIDVKLIICNGGIDGVGNGSNFGEVAYCEAFAGRTTDKIISWMFVGICGLPPTGFHNFPDSIDTETLMRVDLLAFPIDYGLGKIVRVDASREELGGVVILAFVISNCFTSAISIKLICIMRYRPSAPGGPEQ